jgi:hypothetical protein
VFPAWSAAKALAGSTDIPQTGSLAFGTIGDVRFVTVLVFLSDFSIFHFSRIWLYPTLEKGGEGGFEMVRCFKGF